MSKVLNPAESMKTEKKKGRNLDEDLELMGFWSFWTQLKQKNEKHSKLSKIPNVVIVVVARTSESSSIRHLIDTGHNLVEQAWVGQIDRKFLSWHHLFKENNTVDGRNPASPGTHKPCEQWDKLHINWCRMSSINSISPICKIPHDNRTYLIGEFLWKWLIFWGDIKMT